MENVLRLSGRGQALLQAGDVTVDVGTRQVKKAGQEVALTPTEYHLLLVLLHNKNIALYRDTLYERVWGRGRRAGHPHAGHPHSSAAQKLGWQQMIRTIPRVGYRLEERHETCTETGLTILLLLGVLLAAGGGWLTKTDFERNFEQARTQNTLAHRRDTYSLQNGLLAKAGSGEITSQEVADYGSSLGLYVGQEQGGFAAYQANR